MNVAPQAGNLAGGLTNLLPDVQEKHRREADGAAPVVDGFACLRMLALDLAIPHAPVADALALQEGANILVGKFH